MLSLNELVCLHNTVWYHGSANLDSRGVPPGKMSPAKTLLSIPDLAQLVLHKVPHGFIIDINIMWKVFRVYSDRQQSKKERES